MTEDAADAPRVVRRDALAALGGVALVACGGPRSAGSPAAAAVSWPLKTDPVVDLVPAAGLAWLIEMRPGDLFANPALAQAVAQVIPGARFEAFARRQGGVDPRRVEQLAIAAYAQTILVLARAPIEPGRLEAAFAARADSVLGQSEQRGVRQLWGTVRGETEQVAVFGGDAVALERGRMGPLRAAVYFAEQRLHRSAPALHAEPLAQAAALLGAAPLRAFAAGPFEGEWARGAAGLLRGATAVAASGRPALAPSGAIAFRLLLTGAWGDDAPIAAERLRSAFGVLSDDPLGKLTGIDRPVDGPAVSGAPSALTLEVTLDAMALARGIHSLADASLPEIMAY
jgi:hypothetical protein